MEFVERGFLTSVNRVRLRVFLELCVKEIVMSEFARSFRAADLTHKFVNTFQHSSEIMVYSNDDPHRIS